MIIAIPYVPEATNYNDLARVLGTKHKCLGHILHVIHRKEDAEAADKFTNQIVDLFSRTTMTQLEVKERQKFDLPNDLFRVAVRHMENYHADPNDLQDPVLLYYDPAYRPRITGWADEIQLQYYLKRPPVFGNIPALKGAEPSKIFEGPIVISKEWAKTSALLNFLRGDSHWRLYLHHELFKDAVTTKVIGASDTYSVLAKPIKKTKTP